MNITESGFYGGLAPGLDPSVAFRADENGVDKEYIYGRTCHPTGDACADEIAALEGAEKCLLTNSGMAAISTVLLALLNAGDHVIAPNVMYQPTRALLGKLLASLGIRVTFVDARDPINYANAFTPATRLAWIESPANPTLDLTDIRAVSNWAKEKGVITVADNTFSTPLGSRPLDLGVDVVIHSATKYLAGHGDLLAGAILTDTQTKNKILPWLDHLGSALNAHGAWLLRRGLLTLNLRFQRHQANALYVASQLEELESVSEVFYPGLPTFAQRELFESQMKGAGGVVSFVLAGGEDQARAFLPHLRVCAIARSLGEPTTLVAHPWSMHYNALTINEKVTACIPPGLIRVAVGLEDPSTVLADLSQAIEISNR
jgi:methionine-gamma-lyase